MDKTSENHKFLKKAIEKLNDLKQVLSVTSEDLEFNLKSLESNENSDEIKNKIKTIVSRLEVTCKMGCEELENVKNNVVDGFTEFKKLPVQNGENKKSDKIEEKMEIDESKIKQIRVISIEKLMNPNLLKETASTSKSNSKLNSSKIIVLDSDSDESLLVVQKSSVKNSEKSKKYVESDSDGENIRRRPNLRTKKKLVSIIDSDSDDDLLIPKKSTKTSSEPKTRKVSYDKEKIKIQSFQIKLDKLPKNLDKLMTENGLSEILNHKQKVIASLDSDKIVKSRKNDEEKVKNCDSISNSSKTKKRKVDNEDDGKTDSNETTKSKKDDEKDSESDSKKNSRKDDKKSKSREKDSESDGKNRSSKDEKKSNSSKDDENDSQFNSKKSSLKNDKKSQSREKDSESDGKKRSSRDSSKNSLKDDKKSQSREKDSESDGKRSSKDAKKSKSGKDDEKDTEFDEMENSSKDENQSKSRKEAEKDSDSDEKENSGKNDKKSKSGKDDKKDSESDSKKNSRNDDRKSKSREKDSESNGKKRSNKDEKDTESVKNSSKDENELKSRKEVEKDSDSDEKKSKSGKDDEKDSESDGKKSSSKGVEKSKSNKDVEKDSESNEKENSDKEDESLEKEDDNLDLEETDNLDPEENDNLEENKSNEEEDLENKSNEEEDFEENDKNDKKKTKKQTDGENDEKSRKTSSDSEINKNEDAASLSSQKKNKKSKSKRDLNSKLKQKENRKKFNFDSGIGKGSDDEDKSDDKSDSEMSTRTSRRKNAVPQKEAPESDSEIDELKSSDDDEEEKKTNKRKTRDSDDDDFEDKVKESDANSSDSDVFQPKKKRKQDSDSDDDADEDIDDDDKPKKRRRIKKASDDDDSDSDNKNSPNKGRKNIRKVIKSKELETGTKQAARNEMERKRRIEERQKLYNQMFDAEPEKIKEIEKLVLDFDEETKEDLLTVDKKLVKKLKPHQAVGIKFMWDACFETIDRIESSTGSGCILAHCMGLGKSLQVVGLTHTLLTHARKTGVEKVLVICPLSTVLNWVNEYKIWLKHCEKNKFIEIFEISKFKKNAERVFQLTEWHQDGGVMIIGYDMFRNLSTCTGTKLSKKMKEQLHKALVDPGPDIVICDEGHLLKNEKTNLSKAVNKIKSQRRIVLTGTPLQNNLKEYYCMVQFVKPNLLGTYNEYLNRFVNPITNGQYTDSTQYDTRLMKQRSHVLHKLLDGCVQRKDYQVLAPYLPPKHEYVVFTKLRPLQIKLYTQYMETKSAFDSTAKKSSILFSDFQNLQRIWTHPRVLRYNSDKYELNQQKKRDLETSEDESEGSIKDFLNDDDSEDSSTPATTPANSDSEASVKSDEKKKKKKAKKPSIRKTRSNAANFKVEEEEEVVELPGVKIENPTEWWMSLVDETTELDNLDHSGKLMLLLSILEECEAIGDKLLVFSQSLYSLDVIEHFLSLIDENTQNDKEDAKLGGHKGSWSLGVDYFRLDGSTAIENRNIDCKHFNSEDNPRARLFLISTRAGGLGINLVAANRVIIFDVSWNPSHDVQSIFRVYRFGQKKPCYVYRFLAMGTMEEKIYERQVTKQAISKRVIDEQQIDRHYKENDLMELYRFDLEPSEPRELPLLPKDRLFAQLLKKHEDIIWKYHEHDSLLENKEEETLNEEERKAAWEEFEAEKKRPAFTGYNPNMARGMMGGPVTSNMIFGIRSDIMLHLLNVKARQDHPSLSEAESRQMVPHLLKELYSQIEKGEVTLYQNILTLQSQLQVPSMSYGVNPFANANQFNPIMTEQMYGGSGASSRNMGINPFAQQTAMMQQQSMIKQAQNRYIQNMGQSIQPTEIIDLD